MDLSKVDFSKLDDMAKAELKKAEAEFKKLKAQAAPFWKRWSSLVLVGLGAIAGLIVCGLGH